MESLESFPVARSEFVCGVAYLHSSVVDDVTDDEVREFAPPPSQERRADSSRHHAE